MLGESLLATMVARPPLALERVVALAREHYGLETDAVRLSGERDENFRLRTAEGGEYLLKIAHPAEHPSVGDLLTAALEYLQAHDPGLPCPRVIHPRAGTGHVRLTDEGGSERRACVLSYLPGRTLGSGSRSRRQRMACGRLAGRLSSALHGFEHPAARRALIWDVRQVAAVPNVLAQLPAFHHRGRATEILERVVPDIESRWSRLRQQVVHNDLNPLNILVDPADETQVTGIIDFGDMIHTALIADVAVAAAELLPAACAAGAETRNCIRDVALAYHECVPLLPDERALLGTLVAARLVTNLVVQEWHLHHNPCGGHYTALDPHFARSRLEIAAELLCGETEL